MVKYNRHSDVYYHFSKIILAAILEFILDSQRSINVKRFYEVNFKFNVLTLWQSLVNKLV